MIWYLIGIVIGVIITRLYISIKCPCIGEIDISDENLANHMVEMRLAKLPDDINKYDYVFLKVFHKE